MKIKLHKQLRCKQRAAQGLTLVEVLVAFAISGLAMAGIVYGYVFSINSAERFSLSQAANAMATLRMEQIQAAYWDSTRSPVLDQVVTSNFPTQTVTLDLSGAGTNTTLATNYTTITNISTSPPVKRIRVDCVWTYGVSHQLMTNTVETCRAPDQ